MQFSHIAAFVATLALTVSAAPTPGGSGSDGGDTTIIAPTTIFAPSCSNVNNGDVAQVCCNESSSSSGGLANLPIKDISVLSLLNSNRGCALSAQSGCANKQEVFCCSNGGGSASGLIAVNINALNCNKIL